MRAIVRYSSHLLYRKCYKVDRKTRVRPRVQGVACRQTRAGPVLIPYETASVRK